MATLTTFRNSVAKKVGLDNSSSGDQPLIDEWLNQGVLEVLLRTHCTVETGTMSTTASTWEYQLDTDILAVHALWTNDADGNVDLAVREDYVGILNLHYASTSTGDSLIKHYATQGSNLLLVWPTPSEAYTINLLYVPRPTAMSSGAHDPSDSAYGRIPKEFHKLIELYACAEAADFDDDAGSQHGERYRFQFEDGIKRMRKAIRDKGGTRLSPVRVNQRRQRHTALRDPSVSIWP